MIIRPGRLMLSCAGDTDFVAPNSGPQVDGDTGFWDGGPLKVTLKAEPCSDGMSDRRYEFSAAVDLAAATPY